MLISAHPLQRWIDNFYGYGSWDAPTWFVSYEEPGGDLPEEVAEKLNYFSKVHGNDNLPVLCDIRELYRATSARLEGPRASLFSNLHDFRFGLNAIPHGIWKNLAAFEYGYRNQKLPDLLDYQKKSFATSKEALIQLFPLPSPHNHAWYYSWLDIAGFEYLKSRTTYQEHVYAARIQTVLQNIGTHKPDVVLMFGMENINELKRSVQEFYPAAKFKMVKGTKLVTPQHHRADINGTILLITTQVPALRHNRIETGFDWQEFGRRVRTESEP